MNILARVLALFFGAFVFCLSFARAEIRLEQASLHEITTAGVLYQSTSNNFPENLAAIDTWKSTLNPVQKVNLFGGSYWFVVDLNHQTGTSDWVFDPHATIINRVDARLYGQDGSVQILESGYARRLPYSLHYGKNINLGPNQHYRLVVHLDSPYYARQPKFRVIPQENYQQFILQENFLTIAALGALLCLAFYNLFVFFRTKDLSLLYYALYLASTFMGWLWTFHIPTAMFDIHDLRFHYMWFFLIPITSTLFYLSFLRVSQWSPLLFKLSWANIVLSTLLLPTSFFLINYTHTLATLCISIQLSLALISGIYSWRRGFRPAPYFVLAFLALLIPGLFILPANFGLIPDLLENSELATLLGSALDGLLLAFALAERIRSLQDERDLSLLRVTQALELANTDSMTGIGNRHAFDFALKNAFLDAQNKPEPEQVLLILIDLDGLKRINDVYGHARGDELLKQFAQSLKKLTRTNVSCYRLGGDEFTLVSQKQFEQRLRSEIAHIEQHMQQNGFAEFGASVGVAYGSEHQQIGEVFSQADARMYQDKTNRKSGRASMA
jgi:diguanylate cyclase (GGDEF)-like protein